MTFLLKISWLIISWIGSILSMIGAYQVMWFVYVEYFGPPGSTFWGLTVQYFWLLISFLPVFLLPEYFELRIHHRTILCLRMIPVLVFFTACLFELQTYPYRTLILVAMSFCFGWVFLVSTGIGSFSLTSVVRRWGQVTRHK